MSFSAVMFSEWEAKNMQSLRDAVAVECDRKGKS